MRKFDKIGVLGSLDNGLNVTDFYSKYLIHLLKILKYEVWN